MRTLIKGEKRYVGMQIENADGDEFTINSATFTVGSVQNGSCLVNNLTKEVYFLVDTSLAGYVAGEFFVAIFTILLTGLPKVIKGQVVISIV